MSERMIIMYKNKVSTGNNIAGMKIKELRQQISPKMSQRAFAEQLQLIGLDLDKNAIQRIECGKRFITDIELKSICTLLHVSADELLGLNSK